MRPWLALALLCPAADAVVNQRLLALALVAPRASAFVIQSVHGANCSELTHLSAVGGAHVCRPGTDLGSVFAPPTIFVGNQNQAECVVQPFTSSRNWVHCIDQVDGLLLPPYQYDDAAGSPVSYPMRACNRGRSAHCWHVGGNNHGCFLWCVRAVSTPATKPRHHGSGLVQ